MQKSNGRIWLGVLFIIFGGVLVLDNLDIIYFDIFSWPVILLVIGFVILINSKNPTTGIVLIVIGGLFLSGRIFYFDVSDIIADYWPIAVILVGLLIIFQNKTGSHSFKGKHNFDKNIETDEDTIDATCTFSENKIKVTSKNFRGGIVTTTLGSHHIDLYDAELADGNNVLEITTVLGEIDLIIPRDWNVNVQVSSVLGSFEDKRRIDINQVLRPDKTLTIKGNVTLGGGKIKT